MRTILGSLLIVMLSCHGVRTRIEDAPLNLSNSVKIQTGRNNNGLGTVALVIFLVDMLILTLIILLTPFIVHARSADFPADLTKWLVTAPPDRNDDRYWDAYEDNKHSWVVFLQGDRPTARLWMAKREQGSHYPSMQESYPPMPFKIEDDINVEGHSGEWFSKKVKDGWIIGFNNGEWGGGLWWYSPDGKKQSKISDDQVIRFIETDAGLFALEGCSHAFAIDGKIIRLVRGGDGLWHSELVVDLKDTPEAAMQAQDGNLIVATFHGLLRVDPRTKKVDVLLANAFWGGLGPTSIIQSPSGSILIGMRHGVVEVEKIGSVYNPKWLIPDAEYAKAAKEIRANRPPGFR
jgi:hypothetical protein